MRFVRSPFAMLLVTVASACNTGSYYCASGCCSCGVCEDPFLVAQSCRLHSNTICECPAGKFHAPLPEKKCSYCPGPTNSSKNGATDISSCTCRNGEMGLDATQGTALTLGAFTDSETVLSSSDGMFTGAFFAMLYVGAGPVTVRQGSLVIFSCDFDCESFNNIFVTLATADTAFHAAIIVSHSGFLTLYRFTSREVTPDTFDNTLLKSFVVQHRLETGDYVFVDNPLRSTHVCVPCPAGLVCL